MSIIRVGFILGQSEWLGGVNYFRNLFLAIQSLPDTKIRPVIFTSLSSDVSAFDGLAEIIRIPILERKTIPWFLSRVLNKIPPKKDYLLYYLMKKHQINLISHYNPLWRGCSIPTLGWIPDFQHLHLKNFFTNEECVARDKQFMDLITRCNAILLSSQDASNDLTKFFPANKKPTYILRFVSCLHQTYTEGRGTEELIAKHKIDRPWFYIPNQFWIHKNHNIVLEALRLLKAQGINPLVIATGSHSDYRNPEYFPSLMKRVSDYGLQNNFRVLGVLPYSEVIALLKHSIAVINPSFFEGWSTSVEEAKSLGKKIILSDIAVHREQQPSRGYYFDPNDENKLALLIKNNLLEYNEKEEILLSARAQAEQNESITIFAKQYEMICFELINKQ